MQIETVFGCNAKCKMCPVHFPLKEGRQKGIMSWELFKKVVDNAAQFKDKMTKLDLWGVGDPTLDPLIVKRVDYVKKLGFKGVAIATNTELLSPELQKGLLEANLDSIIMGIDGFKKETHEKLRGVNYDKVLKNALSMIKMRNEGNYKTRFIIRFVRQKDNMAEWDDYKAFWLNQLSKDRNDMIISYDVRAWDEEIPHKGELKRRKEIDKKPCHHIFDRLIVLVDGTIIACCGDFHKAKLALGNVNDNKSLLEIFNSGKAKAYRKLHIAGDKCKMDICKDCTIPYSEVGEKRLLNKN